MIDTSYIDDSDPDPINHKLRHTLPERIRGAHLSVLVGRLEADATLFDGAAMKWTMQGNHARARTCIDDARAYRKRAAVYREAHGRLVAGVRAEAAG